MLDHVSPCDAPLDGNPRSRRANIHDGRDEKSNMSKRIQYIPAAQSLILFRLPLHLVAERETGLRRCCCLPFGLDHGRAERLQSTLAACEVIHEVSAASITIARSEQKSVLAWMRIEPQLPTDARHVERIVGRHCDRRDRAVRKPAGLLMIYSHFARLTIQIGRFVRSMYLDLGRTVERGFRTVCLDPWNNCAFPRPFCRRGSSI
jgi:hypothetical protein